MLLCSLALAFGLAEGLWGYSYGTLPSNYAVSDCTSAYSIWATRHRTSGWCTNSLRVDNGGMSIGSTTVSEGMGYGMLMSAYLDSSDANLTELYNLYNGTLDKDGLMNWSVSACGNNSANAATDGDVDMAQAMVEANARWPGNGWDTKAKALLNNIYTYEVDSSCKGLKNGDAWTSSGCSGGNQAYNPSYFCTAYFPNWDCFEGGTRWSAVRDQCYTVLNAKCLSTYALPPDWVTAAGLFGQGDASGGYGYDSCRTPWRVTLDYLWSGDSRSLALANHWAANFAPGGAGAGGNSTAATAAAYIGDDYNYSSGARDGSNHSNCFIGAIGISAMASSSNASFASAVYSTLAATDNQNYFNDSLKVLYLMVMTGQFGPACGGCTGCTATPSPSRTPTFTASPTPTPAFSLAKSASLGTAAIGQTLTYYLSYKNLATGADTTGVTSGVSLQFDNNSQASPQSTVDTNFEIVNASGSAISLSNYRIRYFFYEPSYTTASAYTYSSYYDQSGGASGAIMGFGPYIGSTLSADMELRITYASGTVANGSNVQLQAGYLVSGNPSLTLSDDWSYPGAVGSFTAAAAANIVLEQNVSGTWKLVAGSYPGGAAAIPNVQIADTFDSRLSLVSVAPSGTIAGQAVSVTLASLSPGASGNVTITAYVNGTASAGGAINNTGTISASGYPSATSNTQVLNIAAALTATPTSSRTPTSSATATSTRTSTPSPASTASSTPTSTASPSSTPASSASSTATATPTRSSTPAATATSTATPTPTRSETPSSTGTSTASPTATATAAQSSATSTSSSTASPTGTASCTATPTRTATRTGTPTGSATLSSSPTATATLSGTPSPSFTAVPPNSTATDTPTITSTFSQSPTATASGTPSSSATRSSSATPTMSATATPTATPSSSRTASPSPTELLSPSSTGTISPTPSQTSTISPGPSPTGSPSFTASATLSFSPTATPSSTASATPSASFTIALSSPTSTATLTAIGTGTRSPTPSATADPSGTRTATPTATGTRSPAPSATAEPSGTSTASLSPSGTTGMSGGVTGVLNARPYPNPNPGQLYVKLSGPADTVTVRVYSRALVEVMRVVAPASADRAGWQPVALPASVSTLPNGTWFAVVSAQKGGRTASQTARISFFIKR